MDLTLGALMGEVLIFTPKRVHSIRDRQPHPGDCASDEFLSVLTNFSERLRSANHRNNMGSEHSHKTGRRSEEQRIHKLGRCSEERRIHKLGTYTHKMGKTHNHSKSDELLFGERQQYSAVLAVALCELQLSQEITLTLHSTNETRPGLHTTTRCR